MSGWTAWSVCKPPSAHSGQHTAQHNVAFVNSTDLKYQSLVYMFRNTSITLHEVNASYLQALEAAFKVYMDLI